MGIPESKLRSFYLPSFINPTYLETPATILTPDGITMPEYLTAGRAGAAHARDRRDGPEVRHIRPMRGDRRRHLAADCRRVAPVPSTLFNLNEGAPGPSHSGTGDDD
jgi:hypothetical protein